MNELLLRFGDAPRLLRGAAYALVGLVVFALGYALAGTPLRERARAAGTRAAEAEGALAAARDSLARARPAPEGAAERIRSLLGEMWPEGERFPAGYPSATLTGLSRAAEEAGALAPLFNLRAETTLEGPPLDGFRAYELSGEFTGGTLSVTRFLERIGGLPGPLLLDSLLLVRTIPRNEVRLRIRALRPPAGR